MKPDQGGIRLGLDFDNTLISYDRLFQRVAVEKGLIPAGLALGKRFVRDHIRSADDGNRLWTELQAEVYGVRILEAEAAPGLHRFLETCRAQDCSLVVISHKTRWPALGPRVDLREAALSWLRKQSLLEAGPSEPLQVHFADTREEKLELIAGTDRTHFVDDLPEFLLEPGFPPAVQRILYDPAGSATGEERAALAHFESWEAISRHLFGT